MKILKSHKKTLAGVKSIPTKEVFKVLKKKGFICVLEKGSPGTFKIRTKINGVIFLISATDSGMVYQKEWSRSSFDWIKFYSVDELVSKSLIKKDSPPTDKQMNFINNLLDKLSGLTDIKPKLKPAYNTAQAGEVIRSLMKYVNEAEAEKRQLTTSAE